MPPLLQRANWEHPRKDNCPCKGGGAGTVAHGHQEPSFPSFHRSMPGGKKKQMLAPDSDEEAEEESQESKRLKDKRKKAG